MTVRRLLAAIAVTAVAVIGGASPAAAHGGSGPGPTNYETRVHEVSPSTPGLHVRAIDLGERLELRNQTGETVIVLGYDDEPYLRVGPDGVFENVRSPAVYLNDEPDLTDARVPDSADADATPDWRLVGSGTTARWHDHRALDGKP